MSAHKLPASLPRATHFDEFIADPFEFLTQAHRIHGNLFVIRDTKAVFSRAPGCRGVIAVCGEGYQRAVLNDIESFGLPISAAQQLKLPENLVNLNRSLHSMTADQHAIQKRLLMRLLNDSSMDALRELIWDAIENFTEDWSNGCTVGLLSQMRALILQVSSHVLFGRQTAYNAQLSVLLETYFRLRREASSRTNSASKESIEKLVSVGNSLDCALRTYVRECREKQHIRFDGILAKLATQESTVEGQISEDMVVGHSNIIFVSTTEPLAVTLTWILLMLSQLPKLCDDLRDELCSIEEKDVVLTAEAIGQLNLLDRVVKESLRLLPPNALMVRITTRETSLGEIPLPARCEVILCPFLAHRDDKVFDRPNVFLPSRWKDVTPSSFAYFPFGAGGHSCVGANLALQIIKTTLAFVLPRFDLSLAGDQEIDWKVNIVFMPSDDPVMSIQPSHSSKRLQAGKLNGSIGKLLNLDSI